MSVAGKGSLDGADADGCGDKEDEMEMDETLPAVEKAEQWREGVEEAGEYEDEEEVVSAQPLSFR